MSDISMTKIDFTNGQGEPINDTNLNAMQDNAENAINEVQSNLDDTLEVTTGTGTLNSTYVSSAENNHWERVGKIVTYTFTITTAGTWNHTTEFISGLPRPVTNIRFVANAHSYNQPFRVELTSNGALKNAYSNVSPDAGKTIEGYVSYITVD